MGKWGDGCTGNDVFDTQVLSLHKGGSVRLNPDGACIYRQVRTWPSVVSHFFVLSMSQMHLSQIQIKTLTSVKFCA